MDKKPIIPPVDKELLKAELLPELMLRKTNRAGNEIYVLTAQQAPNVLREIGRLREIAFRDGGGGTGEELDLDKFDLNPAYGYRQLVLWDPDEEVIVGGYRFVLCDEAMYDVHGQPILTSSHMFTFSSLLVIRENSPDGFAVIPRGHSGDTFEVPSEEGKGREAHLVTYRLDVLVPLCEHGFGTEDDVVVNPLAGGTAAYLLYDG